MFRYALALSTILCGAATTLPPSPAPAYYDVRNYGAKGDGATDDYAAINRAKTALPAGGGTLYFPPSAACYVIGTGLSLANNTRILGAGRSSSCIKMKSASNLNMITNATQTGTGIVVQDITIDGNKAGNGAGTSYGIHFTQIAQSGLVNVIVQNVNGACVAFDGNGQPTLSRNNFAYNVLVNTCDTHGFVETFGLRGSMFNGITAINAGNTSGFYGIFLDASETFATNLYCYQCNNAGSLNTATTFGIYIHNVFGSTYNNVAAANGGYEGIRIDQITGSTIVNMRSQNNGVKSSGNLADIHFDSGTGGYGKSQNSVIQGVLAGSNANYPGYVSATEKYALQIDNGPYTNLQITEVSYDGASVTADTSLPSSWGGLYLSDISRVNGQLRTYGDTPTLTGAGTGSPTITGTRYSGSVTEGTTATGAVITWVPQFDTAPNCTVGSPTGSALTSYAVTTTALTIVNASASGNKYAWVCQ